jgi:hypothetical protein
MTRLQSEWQRLYASPVDAATGLTRVLVLSLGAPADWDALSAVWRGVQAELEWPAPGIAVSGTDAFQLWFSLAAPVDAARAQAVLDALCARFLPEVAPARLGRATPPVPPRPQADGNWSAFVAPDLAPVFADTPWLDIEPSADGQAELLARLQPIGPDALEAGEARLRPASAPDHGASSAPASAAAAAAPASVEAQAFLLKVMRDDGVALALRIEAAKALLPRRD